ncbi:MAG: hypothetical protein IJX47_07650 [Clostridia bacterium]|nr:hypothetical protein [Clostridia bacterium]
MKLLLHNVKAALNDPEGDALTAAETKLRAVGLKPTALTLTKRSVDARKREEICYVCSVAAEISGKLSPKQLQKLGAVILHEEELIPQDAVRKRPADAPRPVVVGFGPAGMFAALLLAEEGCRPIVLERGDDVYARADRVEQFLQTGKLDTDSNIQFGAGGAGTFSDGKLITRINDSKCSYVLRRLCEFGADPDILVNARPHIGSDRLPSIVEGIAERIRSLGGEIRYRTKLTGIRTGLSGEVIAALTDCGAIATDTVILAIGHSARDTYRYLIEGGYTVEAKPFSVGVRIEHLQEDINYAMYGKAAEILPPAEYNLSYREGERGVYSFCMCPGGTVMAAASEEGGVVTNGMSNSARDGRNSNSALAVSILPADFGGTPEGAIDFQRRLERAAFAAGGGNYDAPLQTVGDFLSEKQGSAPSRIASTYRGGNHFALSDLHTILPPCAGDLLATGIRRFARQIEGFDAPDALLTGLETRTSAPLRILRGGDRQAVGHPGLYPCGEGAGYAGGITSAATDGLATAIAVLYGT